MGYVDRIWGKYTAKWGVQIAEMNFQTRSSVSGYLYTVYYQPYPQKQCRKLLNLYQKVMILLISGKSGIIIQDEE